MLIASADEDCSAPKTVSLPADKPVKLVLRPTVWVRFNFPGFRSETVAMTSNLGTESTSYSIDEERRIRLPIGNHQAAVRTWSNGKTYAARANFRVYPERRKNVVEILLREQLGLRATVTDANGKPLGGVEVFAYHSSTTDTFEVDGECARILTEDGGRSCANAPRYDVSGFTDADGVFEATPSGREAEPLYRFTLGGVWRDQHPAMMRFGDEPVTIVAVPR